MERGGKRQGRGRKGFGTACKRKQHKTVSLGQLVMDTICHSFHYFSFIVIVTINRFAIPPWGICFV